MFLLQSHVLTVSKTHIFIQEQVQDKKITGINGSHFLYLFGDLIERVIIYEKKMNLKF